MDSKGALTIFDTPGKNCPLNILAPVYKKLTGGGSFNPNLSNKVTFFHYDIRAG